MGKEAEEMKVRYFRVLTTLAAGALVASLLAEPAGAAFPGTNGEILFQSDRTTMASPEGDYEIFTMNPDGTNVIQLTFNAATDHSPTFSPDGTKIAFTSTRDESLDVFKMNSGGTSQTNMTNDASGDLDPDWQPF